MKIGLLMLPFVCAAAVAMAADEREPVMAPEPSGAAPGMSPPHYRMINSKKKILPGGDLRQCLELKTSREIIRCSERAAKNNRASSASQRAFKPGHEVNKSWVHLESGR